jgi:dethiobiotin synthetase
MSAIFISATGTDIGKTFVARGLIRALRARGRKVTALKPIMSGFEPAEAGGSDAGLLLAALGEPVTLEAIARMSPWRFALPLSPDMAAAREARTLDFPAIVDFCRTAIAASRDTLVIEGVGGIMTPIDNEQTVLDWMSALGLPVVLVAGSYLGTISHTLTALDVLGRRRLAVTSLAISQTAGSPVSLDETHSAIARFARQLDIVALPRLTASLDHPAFERIADRV